MAANTASGPIQLASQYRIDTPETINDMEMRPLTSAPEDDFHSTLINGCSCNYHIGETLAKLKRQRAPAQNCNGSTEQIQRSTDVPDCLQRPCDIISPPESTERTVVRLKKVDDWAEVFRSYWPQLVQKTNNNKGLVLSQAIQNKPVLLNAFLTMLSNCIFFQQENPTQGTLIGIDLKFLLEKLEVKSNFRESYVLDHLVKELEDSDSKNRILAHPPVKVVATLKCQKHKLLSKIAVGFHTLFAFLFTICTFITLWKHPFVLTVIPNILNGILGAMAVVSLIKTCISFTAPKAQFVHTKVRKMCELFASIVAIGTCVIPNLTGYLLLISHSVNKDITAFGVMVSWLVMLSYLTKFPQTATYVETFFQIVKSFIKFFLVVAIWLFIALSVSHAIIFHQDDSDFHPIANVSRSYIRAITGRMNYEEFTGQKLEFENPFSVFIYFFLFLILSTVMASMIIGLATNGLDKTRAKSAVNVLCQAIEDIAELEWTLAKTFGRFSSCRWHKWLVEKISVKNMLTNRNAYLLEIRPHDPNDTILPASLKKEIFMHLMERKKTCTNH